MHSVFFNEPFENLWELKESNNEEIISFNISIAFSTFLSGIRLLKNLVL